jgi:hypothetical protein
MLQVRMKRAPLSEESMSRRAGFHHGLVGDDADHHAADAGEADHQVFREIGHDFEEIAVVHQTMDHLKHVDRFLRAGGDQFVHAGVAGDVEWLVEVVGRVADVVARQEGEQAGGQGHGVAVVLGDEVDVAADRGMGGGAGELGEVGVFAGGGLDDVGPADEHVGVVLVMIRKSISAGE